MNKVLLEMHNTLGITDDHLHHNRLLFHEQPILADLKIVEIDFEGKPFVLLCSAADAWVKMKEAAQKDKISLMPFSGFRSYIHQKNIIEKQLKNGRQIKDILTHIAIPGFSEHHSGRAVDIHKAGQPVLEEEFEKSDAFAWLTHNAHRFEFNLSYPRGNSFGIIYEPWHWFYSGD